MLNELQLNKNQLYKKHSQQSAINNIQHQTKTESTSNQLTNRESRCYQSSDYYCLNQNNNYGKYLENSSIRYSYPYYNEYQNKDSVFSRTQPTHLDMTFDQSRHLSQVFNTNDVSTDSYREMNNPQGYFNNAMLEDVFATNKYERNFSSEIGTNIKSYVDNNYNLCAEYNKKNRLENVYEDHNQHQKNFDYQLNYVPEYLLLNKTASTYSNINNYNQCRKLPYKQYEAKQPDEINYYFYEDHSPIHVPRLECNVNDANHKFPVDKPNSHMTNWNDPALCSREIQEFNAEAELIANNQPGWTNNHSRSDNNYCKNKEEQAKQEEFQLNTLLSITEELILEPYMYNILNQALYTNINQPEPNLFFKANWQQLLKIEMEKLSGHSHCLDNIYNKENGIDVRLSPAEMQIVARLCYVLAVAASKLPTVRGVYLDKKRLLWRGNWREYGKVKTRGFTQKKEGFHARNMAIIARKLVELRTCYIHLRNVVTINTVQYKNYCNSKR